MIAIQTNNYTVKATMPAGNPWQERNLTLEQAEARARWFVCEWVANGLVQAKAGVFYQGQLVKEVSAQSCCVIEPDADMGRMEHDDRGDN